MVDVDVGYANTGHCNQTVNRVIFYIKLENVF